MAECFDTAYVESGTELYVKGKKGRRLFGQVVDVPPKESFVRLRVGDLLVITREGSFDEPSVTVPGAHRLTCPSGYLFDSVKPGKPLVLMTEKYGEQSKELALQRLLSPSLMLVQKVRN